MFLCYISIDFTADSTDDNMGANIDNESKMSKYFSDSIILDNWAFKNFISAVKLFAKALRIFETCVLITKNVSRKLISLHW